MTKLTDRRGEINELKEYADDDHVAVDFTSSTFFRAEFISVSFNGCNFTRVCFESARFEGCTFHRCNFTEAELLGTEFYDCTFSHCTYDGAVIAGINLELTRWDGALLHLPNTETIVIVPTSTGIAADMSDGKGLLPADERITKLRAAAEHLLDEGNPLPLTADKIESTARLVEGAVAYLDNDARLFPRQAV